MDKDLHSGVAEGFGVIKVIKIGDFNYVAIEGGGRLEVATAYHKDSGFRDVDKDCLPVEITIINDRLDWERFDSGNEYGYGDDGKIVWSRDYDGTEMGLKQNMIGVK